MTLPNQNINHQNIEIKTKTENKTPPKLTLVQSSLQSNQQLSQKWLE